MRRDASGQCCWDWRPNWSGMRARRIPTVKGRELGQGVGRDPGQISDKSSDQSRLIVVSAHWRERT